MHTRARTFFVLAILTGSTMLGVATRAALTPKPVAVIVQDAVAIGSLSRLLDRTPQLVFAPDLSGLEARARQARNWSFGRSPLPRALPVYLVKDGDELFGFIAYDPRNGCDLELLAPSVGAAYGAVFHDVCHGSLYDLKGEKRGGPTPFTLDQVVLRVDGDKVFASLRDVRPGRQVLR